jgi:hypothetical protein
MTARQVERIDQPLRHRKIRDRAFILFLVGLILLTPPVAGIFQLDEKISGIPFTLVYLFVVWALLIAGAARFSNQLRDNEASPDADHISEHPDPAP